MKSFIIAIILSLSMVTALAVSVAQSENKVFHTMMKRQAVESCMGAGGSCIQSCDCCCSARVCSGGKCRNKNLIFSHGDMLNCHVDCPL